VLATLTDFLLVVTLRGRERDEYEFEQRCSRVGLRVQRILPTTSAYKVPEVS
jgi:hypothetical protein